MLVKFRIQGNLRFLSHAETIKVFQRACARAGIKMRYSQGFNPRPRLSLPLPRSVGVESDGDLLCLWVHNWQQTCETQLQAPNSSPDTEQFRAKLIAQLPGGCELLSVSTARGKNSFQPTLATYILAIEPKYINEKFKIKIKDLLASNSLQLQRRMNAKNSKFKNVDVRPFLKSIDLKDENVIVRCKISSAGAIRVDEILKLLELDVEKLTAPIKRTNVQWQEKIKG